MHALATAVGLHMTLGAVDACKDRAEHNPQFF